jgi:hypothetical protein
MLFGGETEALYSPNRSRTPEPTLPQLEGILQKYSEKSGVEIKTTQLDLRDPLNGSVETVHYGNLMLPYISENIKKIYYGINIQSVIDAIAKADVVGFTNNFAMSRRVVCDHISMIRKHFPEKEIWLGGRDLYSDKIKYLYARAAGGSCVIFDGHVFESLPAYLDWKFGKGQDIFGITFYNKMECRKIPAKTLAACAKEGTVDIPLPVYKNPESLGYFTGSGEGNPFDSRFAHMTLSIGCPFACGYCTTGYRERYLVHKSLEAISAELKMYKNLGVTTLAIMDDNLLALGSEKVKSIMSLINSYGFMVEYGNGLMLSALMGNNWNEFAETVFSNCISLYAPLEDLTTDRMYDKLAPINKELELMKQIRDANFPNLKYITMGVIFGVPGHTKEKLKGNFMKNMERFLKVFSGSSLEVAMTVFNYMPLSGTKFGDEALNSERMVVSDPFYQNPEVCSFGTTSYAPESMTHADVFHLYQKALNMNPAGKDLGLTYVQLQQLGEKAFSLEERWKIPNKWQVPGFHLRARVV